MTEVSKVNIERTRKRTRKSLSKVDLADVMAKSAGITKGVAEKALDDALDTVAGSVKSGVSVKLKGFGVFSRHVSPPRSGRNPKTGESVDIPERKSMKFRATKVMRDLA